MASRLPSHPARNVGYDQSAQIPERAVLFEDASDFTGQLLTLSKRQIDLSCGILVSLSIR